MRVKQHGQIWHCVRRSCVGFTSCGLTWHRNRSSWMQTLVRVDQELYNPKSMNMRCISRSPSVYQHEYSEQVCDNCKGFSSKKKRKGRCWATGKIWNRNLQSRIFSGSRQIDRQSSSISRHQIITEALVQAQSFSPKNQFSHQTSWMDLLSLSKQFDDIPYQQRRKVIRIMQTWWSLLCGWNMLE